MQHNNIKALLIIVLGLISGVALKAQGVDSLSFYLEYAAKNNPELKGYFLNYQASLEKIPQAGAWSDPQLDIGFFVKPMDIVGGQQIADITLMQMFPWFGTKKAAQTEAVHMAQMAYEQFREAKDELYLELYTQWYALSALKQQLSINRDNLSLLKQVEQLSLRKVSAPPLDGGITAMGSSSPGMAGVLRVQLEALDVENNIESILSEMEAEKARFNALLNRPLDAEVFLPDTLIQVPLFLDKEIVLKQVESQNPALNMLREEELAFRAKNEMNKKMGLPMLGVGLQYMLIGESEMMNSNPDGGMNGMDMLMPMVSVSLPIYRNKYKASRRESRFMWEAATEKYHNSLNTLQSELHKLISGLENAERKIALYRKQEQLAQTGYNLLVAGYASAKSDISELIQLQRQLLDYQLKLAKAIAEYNTLAASVLKLQSFNTANNLN
ncbi:MAG: TolC family protein [Bacteroidales bacterium]|nr:TolC family protein [Bacteroidales bacterium]